MLKTILKYRRRQIINIYAVNSKENDRKMFPFWLKPSRLQGTAKDQRKQTAQALYSLYFICQ